VYDFWLSPGISHPTGNKSDIKRERLAPNIYASHMAQVIEKTQIDAYIDPIRFSPEIRLVGIPNCLQSCISHLDFSRFSPLTDAVTVFITVRASFGTKILKSEPLAWNLTLRKTRRDARKRE
jgi:hypothetical protein